MGTYLSQPNTTKRSRDGVFTLPTHEVKDNEIADPEYGVSDMQGWRQSMEDAYIAAPNIESGNAPPGTSLFAIFDGHGGKEVSKFCANHFLEELLLLREFTDGNYSQSLIECFHRMDDMLRDKKYAKELQLFRRDSDVDVNDKDEEGDDAETSQKMKENVESTPDISSDIKRRNSQEDEHFEDDDDDPKKNISNSVKKQLEAAEAKGTLSKGEALDLMLKMLKLKRMENDQKEGNETPTFLTDAGCTAIAALLLEKYLYVANAGDSRGVLCCDGKAVPLSEDHKPNDQQELNRIEAAGGHVTEQGRVNGNLNLSRSIGDLKYKVNDELDRAQQIITAQPDVRVFPIGPKDYFFILACDGVWDILSNEEIVELVKAQVVEDGILKVSTIIENIFDRCISVDPYKTQGLGGDNMTCIIVFLKPIAEVRNILTNQK
eukprot:CAMPEP_0204829486 /NCGR_PEP_ID=MMETSP1346-20131115/7682_1 /ASSEMBLY_ACC=CAM_ASM_000771 /TAXON_ID=215587 /ORGANISM="Aplanochytrium stocchinoi, Strain GSBS06" /LENGTH=432 /DNA_ID=CAMNT_0051959321 /DNA_START=244 /DNA_END=1542 /DNA_ORIENTATION=+